MIIKVELKGDGRQLKQTFTGSFITSITVAGNYSSRTTTPVVKTSGSVVYCVYCDRADEMPIALLSDSRLPQLGSTYVENGATFNGVYYSDATPRYIGVRGNAFMWEITYGIGGEFSKNVQSTSGGVETPPATLLSFSTSMELEDYAGAVDLDGKWNTNSLGEFFADPLVYKSGILSLKYSRREYENPLWKIRDFFQCVNDSEWYGFGAGTVKVADVSFSATQTEASTSYDVSYVLQYRPRGWSVVKANSGLYCKSGANVVRATNADGSPTDGPVLLALDGSRLQPGAEVPTLALRTNPTADLYALELPDPFTL